MNILNVKQIIQELAMQSFTDYPDSYKSAADAQELANNYWDVRTEEEIERDEDLGIIQADYQRWVVDIISKQY